MEKFQIGDRVERTSGFGPYAPTGTQAVVTGVNPRGEEVRVELACGKVQTWLVENCRKVRGARDNAQPLLPHDSDERKGIPLYSVLFGYFPSAMVALAKHAHDSNEKHNPGEELHWSRAKSDDHADAALRHLVEGDYVGLLWRAAALLQLELEEQGHSVAPLAK